MNTSASENICREGYVCENIICKCHCIYFHINSFTAFIFLRATLYFNKTQKKQNELNLVYLLKPEICSTETYNF